jgi:predicted RNA binding protein YcfA (HicA-like mRNA interferase family)
MAKLPILSAKDIIRILHLAGFEPAPKRGKGSHLAFVKRTDERAYLVIVPDRKNIPRGTLKSIVDQSGMTKEEFIKLLD